MNAGHPQSIILSIHLDVLLVTLLELLDGGFDMLHATGLAHFDRRNIGVKTGTVPVAGDGLGMEGDLGAKLFRDAVEQKPRKPELVTHCKPNTLSANPAAVGWP